MTCGLVLAGGGARGAYEMGVLAELLPKLDTKIDIVVGTSIGAVNATFLAARADDAVGDVVEAGVDAWSKLQLKDIIRSVPHLSRDALLDAAPIERTLERLVDVGQIERNVTGGDLTAAAVVATASATGRTVVFHCGGNPKEVDDRRRDIHYAATPLGYGHIRASAALPALFPAVEVTAPPGAEGWYFDGGTRLNTPIKPAIELGADRVVVVGLSSIAPRDPPQEDQSRPDVFASASHVLQGLFDDQLTADMRELTDRNARPRRDDDKVIPYIFVAPQTRGAIGDAAAEVFREDLGRFRDLLHDPGLGVLGRLVHGGEDAIHGELLSYLFFDPTFADRLMQMGRDDAARTLAEGLWRT
jgi:NTE family protein